MKIPEVNLNRIQNACLENRTDLLANELHELSLLALTPQIIADQSRLVSCLHGAVAKANDDIVRMLLAYGVSPDAIDGIGVCAFAKVQRLSTAQILISHGANMELDIHGETPIQKLIGEALRYAAPSSFQAIKILIQAGADVHVKSSLKEPILVHLCSYSGIHNHSHLAAVVAAFEAGADLHERSANGQNAWGLLCCRCIKDPPQAYRSARNELIDFLISTGHEFDEPSGQRLMVFAGLGMEGRGRDMAKLNKVQPLGQKDLNDLLIRAIKNQKLEVCTALLEMGAHTPKPGLMEMSGQIEALLLSWQAKNHAKLALAALGTSASSDDVGVTRGARP